jgi:hypothetical protein
MLLLYMVYRGECQYREGLENDFSDNVMMAVGFIIEAGAAKNQKFCR